MTRAIAVLRPEPGNAATAARVEAIGLRAIRLPLFVVRPVAWTPPDPRDFDALLLTSANAVRHAGDAMAMLAALPVVAVGEATARAARAAGLAVIHVGTGDARSAIAGAGVARLLHLAGREHADTGVPRAVVYAADALPIASTAALEGSVALLHSIRAARRFADLARRDGLIDMRVAALSQAILVAADHPGEAAATPDDAALVALAARLAGRSGATAWIDPQATAGDKRRR